MKLTKKVLATALALTLVVSLAACGKSEPKVGSTDDATTTEAPKDNTTPTEESKDATPAADNATGIELALITDVGTIDDKSFNQGAWEGVEAYGKEFNKTFKYYKPTEKSDDAYMNSIDLAVKAGAKVIVCPGYLFEVPIFQAQTKYPEVNFIILDGAPHAGDYNNVLTDNTLAIFYAEEEAGFLAGYSIVKEGYTKLGFMGGIAVPAVVRYGYGFIQGANAAAEELGLANDAIQMKYTYVGNFDATPENLAKAAAWYNEGTEVIFACGGAVGNSVMKAAETANAKVIGVDVDQSPESKTVITSSMKNLSKSVYDALTSYYGNSFAGGTIVTLDASVEGVELPMATSTFTKFTEADYNEIYSKIVNKEYEIGKDTVAADASGVPGDKVAVELIK